MKKTLLLFVCFNIFLLISSCNAVNDDAQYMLNKLRSVETQHIPFRLKNNTDYYPLAMKYVQKFGFDSHADSVLYKAVIQKTIHHQDTVNYYLSALLKADNKIDFDLIYMQNYRFIDKSHLPIFKYYYSEDPRFINLLSELPSFEAKNPYGVSAKTAEYLTTIRKFSDRNSSMDLGFYLENYISKVWQNLKDEDKQTLLSLSANYGPHSTLEIIFAWTASSKQLYLDSIEKAVKYEIDNYNRKAPDTAYYRMKLLQDIGISFGSRKLFYNVLTKYQNANEIVRYFYLDNLKYFSGYNAAIPQMAEMAKKLSNQTCEMARQLRFTVLTQQNTVNEEYINDAIAYYNDFSGMVYSTIALNSMFRQVMLARKGSLLAKYVNKIKLDDFTVSEKAALYYDMYLMDSENKDSWLSLINQYPFEYPSLAINGKFPNHTFKKATPPVPLSVNAKKALAITASLLNFDLPNNINFDESFYSLADTDRYHVYNKIATHFAKTGNSLMAIKYHLKKFDCIYETGYTDISFEDFTTIYPMPYKDLVLKYSKANNITPQLAYGIMREESRFVADILSYVGATGLMQIMPTTGKWIADRTGMKSFDLKNPEDNIKMGTYYLDYLKYYTEDMRFVIAGYNAGPGKAKKWLSDYAKYDELMRTELIPIRETRNYVRRVMTSYYIYEYLLNL